MNRLLLLISALVVVVVPMSAQRASAPAVLATRLITDGPRSFLAEVREAAGQVVDDIRFELPGNAANTAVLQMAPKGWQMEKDGRWIRLFGLATMPPFRIRIALFDVKTLERVRTRLRIQNRNIFEGNIDVAAMPDLTVATSPTGRIALPAIVTPGEAIDLEIADPKQTPSDGQWFIGGVQATPDGEKRLRVQLPEDLPTGSGLRVSYFDVWGERIMDALAPPDVDIMEKKASPSTNPRITGCSRYGFLGQSVCVCGDFPEAARGGLMIDGQPAQVISASQNVVHVRLPEAIGTGLHTISGTTAAGFTSNDNATTRAVALRASLDSSALLRGQSTVMSLAVAGATERLTMSVINRTPQNVSIPGGNYQEIQTSGDETVPVERRVDARLPGNFTIDVSITELPCPCMAHRSPDYVSSASRQAPVFVPRRILATIAVAAPAAMAATAQAVAAANGLSVVEVTPLPLANQALVTFEIVDGIGAIAKAAAVAADPNVTLAQPDFVYDTFQAGTPAASLAYGPGMIGADVARGVSLGDGVRIAVIDSGIDTGNLRLQKRIAEFSDVTGTGWTPDIHGTLVAGVIAADAGEDGAPAGIASGAALVGVKSCVALSATQASARCWSSTLARGIDVASGKNVRLMNLSVGGPEDRLLARMIQAATAKGITVVSAAGNDGPTGKPSYPAAIDNVIAVTAVDATGRLYQRATRGAFIDLAAPGVDIMSTGPGGRTQLFSGTSAATAFASGAVALVLQRSNLTSEQLRTLLRSTAKDLGSRGRDDEFGDGLLDVCRAVAQSSGRQVACR